MNDLFEIGKRLGDSYREWKTKEKEKNKYRDQFFRVATERLEGETPAQIYEQVVASDREEAIKIAQKKFPRFTVLDAIEDEYDIWRVVLEENPVYRSFSFVNPVDGMVYQRVIVEGSPMLDDERLKEEDPEFWAEISHIPQERVMKPIEDLTQDQIAKLQEYVYTAKPTVKLAAPRKAKSEELELADSE